MEGSFQYPVTQCETSHKGIDKSKTSSTEIDDNSSCFDCNICLDLVQDPVVTLCGHLYCWSCIYRWLHSQKPTPEDPDQLPKCPVCKTDVSQNALIPLYGRGRSGKPSDIKATQLEPVIPHRPNSKPGIHPHVDGLSTSSRSHRTQQLHYNGRYPLHEGVDPDYSLAGHSWSPAYGFAGTTTLYPVIGMFGEMICSRFFGNSETAFYTYPSNTYSTGTSSSSTRVRRHVLLAERSLSRVSFFLFCCVILCLLLF